MSCHGRVASVFPTGHRAGKGAILGLLECPLECIGAGSQLLIGQGILMVIVELRENNCGLAYVRLTGSLR